LPRRSRRRRLFRFPHGGEVMAPFHHHQAAAGDRYCWQTARAVRSPAASPDRGCADHQHRTFRDSRPPVGREACETVSSPTAAMLADAGVGQGDLGQLALQRLERLIRGRPLRAVRKRCSGPPLAVVPAAISAGRHRGNGHSRRPEFAPQLRHGPLASAASTA